MSDSTLESIHQAKVIADLKMEISDLKQQMRLLVEERDALKLAFTVVARTPTDRSDVDPEDAE